MSARLRAFSFRFSATLAIRTRGTQKARLDARQIGDPATLRPSSPELILIRLQAAKRHIQQEEQPAVKKSTKPSKKVRPFHLFETHMKAACVALLIRILPPWLLGAHLIS